MNQLPGLILSFDDTQFNCQIFLKINFVFNYLENSVNIKYETLCQTSFHQKFMLRKTTKMTLLLYCKQKFLNCLQYLNIILLTLSLYFSIEYEALLNQIWSITLRIIPEFHLISQCGNFLERHRHRRIARNSAETVPFHEISTTGNQGKFRYFTQCR